MLTTQGRVILAEAGFWVDKEGNVWKICELSEDHINNLLGFLQKCVRRSIRNKDYYSKLLLVVENEFDYRWRYNLPF